MMSTWSREAIFYHIYPLGFCGAPKFNDFISKPVHRLKKVDAWIDHINYLGANAIYFGPIFESTAHGYDTADYFNVDRRLGDNATFSEISKALHNHGFRVVLDGVFNHVGRDFFAFKDVQVNGRNSKYLDWFSGIDFRSQSPLNDPFNYDTWNGYYNLVKLNLQNLEVKEHLFRAVKFWIKEFDIDGLRLDCADCLHHDFMRELSLLCKSIKPEFFLIGEVLHGDYNRWANGTMLDSVTNYECYKGLYSSHNDKNYFEIAYSLNRQFGEGSGIYRGLPLYNFADNHDVDRVASVLNRTAYLYPLHALLFTMPGIPSIYYGSEWGIEGDKKISDDALRPSLELNTVSRQSPNKDLSKAISNLSRIRKASNALKYGIYKQIKVLHQQFAFARIAPDECMIILVNSSDKPSKMIIDMPVKCSKVIDLLNNNEVFSVQDRKCTISHLYPCWARILKVIQ